MYIRGRGTGIYIAAYLTDIARKEPDARFSPQELIMSVAGGGFAGLILGSGSAALAQNLQRLSGGRIPTNINTYNSVEKNAEKSYNENKEGELNAEKEPLGYGQRRTDTIYEEFTGKNGRKRKTGEDRQIAEEWFRRRFRNISDKRSDRIRYERIINSPAFYARNWEGRPILLFHGTNADFDEFKASPTDIGIHFGNILQAEEILWRKNGHRIIAVELYLKNPIYVGADNFGMETTNGYFDLLYSTSDLSDADIEYIKEHSGKYYELKTKLQEEMVKLIEGKGSIVQANNLIDEIENMFKQYVGISELELSNEINRSLERDLQYLGYDGIVYNNNSEGYGLSYAVFDNNQITQIDKNYKKQDLR